MVLSEGYVPNADNYASEYQAGTLIKVNAAGLTQYDRVLNVDLDMFAVSSLRGHFLREYREHLVGRRKLNPGLKAPRFQSTPVPKVQPNKR